MNYSFIVRTNAIVICVFLLAGMILVFSVGRAMSRRWKSGEGETKGGINMLQTSLFGLFGFILAFSFGMSGTRYESVRNVIVEEKNAIETAIARSDLYPDSIRNIFRNHFREFVQARLDIYRNPWHNDTFQANTRHMKDAETALWKLATDQSKLYGMLIPTGQMIPALNEMFDVASSRDILLRSSIPDIIIYMLLILALTTSFIAGFTTHIVSRNELVIFLCFILFTTLVIYITIDMGRPLRGVIRAHVGQQALDDLVKLFD
jgi:hypothetical protein